MPWWKKIITSPAWRHCWVIWADEYNWMLASSDAKALHFCIMPYAVDDPVPQMYANAKCRVLEVIKPEETRWLGRGILTCVSMVKALLGLRCPLVWTPYGLYQWLRTHAGGETQVREICHGSIQAVDVGGTEAATPQA